MPERVTTLVVAPPVPPYSGGALRENPELAITSQPDLRAYPPVHGFFHVLRAIEQVETLLGPHAVHRIRLSLPQRAARGGHAGVSGATPVCSRPSCVKLRPFRGGKRISRPLTTFPSVLVEASTSGAWLVTVTVSLRDATSVQRAARSGSVHLDRLLHQLREVGGLDGHAVIWPTGKSGSRKSPSADACASLVNPVSRFRATTWAPATTPAVLSVTTPSIAPVGSWASPRIGTSTSTTTPAIDFRDIGGSPVRLTRCFKWAASGLRVHRRRRRCRHVAHRGDERAALAIELGILRRPRRQAVDVPVAEAEHRGDEDGVVNLEVGGPELARALDVGRRDVLTVPRGLAGNDQQRLEFFRDGRR